MGAGRPAPTAVLMIAAGTSQFTSDGRNSAKNPENGISPFCHTISVVMSPNGENHRPLREVRQIELLAVESDESLNIALLDGRDLAADPKPSQLGEQNVLNGRNRD